MVLAVLGLTVGASDRGEAPAPAASATAGYVPDRSCAICHSEIYQSYQEVGMARSFFRPSAGKVIEDWGEPYFHERSGRYYEMSHRDGRFVFKRWQLAPDGEPINVFEQDVDWVLGSGNHSRTYLFQTKSGELYQLPVAWYTQTSSWGLAPGFDASHLGVARRVPRECMFCHNAYPDVPQGSDAHFEYPTYPAELPQGTGCQRCHGPAEEHVRAATEHLEDMALVRSTIVNPARLPPRLRDDVCDQCHLQPTVALAGVRRFGRGDYSYRPGEPLSDYLVEVDVDVEGEPRSERFEINHHPYRLRQSRCFKESGRKLSCLTCHDPHRKVPEEERAAHYREACLTCHQVDQCGLEGMTAGDLPSGVDPLDCVACHMAKRRTEDVVQVVMTDHLIRRRPGGPELLAPREESVPILVDVELADPERAPAGALGEMYRAVAVQRAGGNEAAVEHLGRMLNAVRPSAVEPYLDFGKGLIQLGRYGEAEKILHGILQRHGPAARAEEWRSIALYRLGRVDEAVAALRRVVGRDPETTADAWYNLGVFLNGTGRRDEAVECLEKAVTVRPVMAPAWYQLGQAQLGLGRPDDAVASFKEALAVDPAHGPTYKILGETLLRQGHKEEALRYRRLGAKLASGTESIATAPESAGE